MSKPQGMEMSLTLREKVARDLYVSARGQQAETPRWCFDLADVALLATVEWLREEAGSDGAHGYRPDLRSAAAWIARSLEGQHDG